jgi:hypothetical protein
MRTFGFANVLLGISVIVTGCEKHLTPQQAEVLLAKAYSNPGQWAEFTCRKASAIGSTSAR